MGDSISLRVSGNPLRGRPGLHSAMTDETWAK